MTLCYEWIPLQPLCDASSSTQALTVQFSPQSRLLLPALHGKKYFSRMIREVLLVEGSVPNSSSFCYSSLCLRCVSFVGSAGSVHRGL